VLAAFTLHSAQLEENGTGVGHTHTHTHWGSVLCIATAVSECVCVSAAQHRSLLLCRTPLLAINYVLFSCIHSPAISMTVCNLHDGCVCNNI
jgi:hypothetical protein